VGGTLTFSFHPAVWKEQGWTLASNGAIDGDRPDTRFSFSLSDGEMIRRESPEPEMAPGDLAGWVETAGALLLTGKEKRAVIGNFWLGLEGNGVWEIRSRLGPSHEFVAFFPTDVRVEFDEHRSRLRVGGDLRASRFWAEMLGDVSLARHVLGAFEMVADLEPGMRASGDADPGTSTVERTTGADVIVGSIHDAFSYGTDPITNVAVFALGTTSCNAGDVPLSWFGTTPNHPVIAQNMYR
ncbi:MAG: hypothetical protein IH987_18840, partial [Planctomycetes bacterium]|nr:hypothetical protein [Planctomycetota bacterium]